LANINFAITAISNRQITLYRVCWPTKSTWNGTTDN